MGFLSEKRFACVVPCFSCLPSLASVLSTYEPYLICLVFYNVSCKYKLRSFGSLDSGDKQIIQEAADVIAKHTCIRFVERQDQEDYIEFYEDSKYDTKIVFFFSSIYAD